MPRSSASPLFPIRTFISLYREGVRKRRYRQEYSVLVFTPYRIPQAAVQRLEDSLRRSVKALAGSTAKFTLGIEANRVVSGSERSQPYWHAVYRHEVINGSQIVSSEEFAAVNLRPRFGRDAEKVSIHERIVQAFIARLFGAFH